MKALVTNPVPWAIALIAALSACAIPTAPISEATPSPTSVRSGPGAEIAASPTPAPPPPTDAPPTAAPATAAAPTGAPPAEATLADSVLTLVNAERAAAGCPAVALEARLSAAAQAHSDDMAGNNFMDHQGSDGSQVGDRARAAGYDWRGIGENVAAGYVAPEELVAGWMGSPGHRDIILTCDYVDAGVGYTYDTETEYGHYWTLVLAQ